MAVFKLKELNKKVLIGDEGIVTKKKQDPEKIELIKIRKEKERLTREIEELKKEASNIISEAKNEAQSILSNKEQNQQEGQKILEEAKAEAERIKIEAQNEIEKEAQIRYEKAHDEGYEKGAALGEQEALKSVREEYTNILKEAEQIASNVIEKKDEIIRNSDKEILKTVLVIAKKIVNSELKINEEVVYNNIKAALSRLTDKENVTIHINHKDLEQVDSRREEFFSVIRGLKNFKVIEENYLNPGDCIIETDYGFIDAVIQSQFEELERSLLEEDL